MRHILVLDVGTSSAKAVLFDERSAIQAEGEAPYPTLGEAAGREEQIAEDWVRAACDAVQQLDLGESELELIVLTGTMQSVIAVDASGCSLRPAILYSDSRAEGEFEGLLGPMKRAGGAALIGNAPNPYMSAFKVEWMRQHERDLFDKVVTFHSGSKDVVAQWLTGKIATDPTAATTVGLMDIHALRWNPALLELFDLDATRLPDILPADAIVGPLLAGPAQALGLRPGTPVMNGCGDAGASTLGAGIDQPGETYVYVGTSAWAAQIADRFEVSDDEDQKSIYTLAHPRGGGRFIRIGAMLSGGDSVAWFAATMGRDVDALDALLDEPTFRPSEIMFLPYLKGERCPFMDSKVRGSFLFIDRSDGPAQMHHAVLEGIGYAIKSNLDALGAIKGDLALLGGGAVSQHLPQLLSDICQRTVAVAERPAAMTSFGAYSLGASRLGWPLSPPPVERKVQPRPEIQPRMSARQVAFEVATSAARKIHHISGQS